MKALETIKKLEAEILEAETKFQFSTESEKKRLYDLCPEYLFDLAKDYGLIISGGVITSLFCNREVSDIDVYVKNKEDVFSVVTELLQNSTPICIPGKSQI